MGRALVAVLLLSVFSGCNGIFRAIFNIEDPDLRDARVAAGLLLSCPAEKMIAHKGHDPRPVEGCDREARCERGRDAVTRCVETQLSIERSTQKLVVDRLSVETGCSTDEIEVVKAADWTRGTERAYRLFACGATYVCVTSMRGTECKAALADSPPATPPPQQVPLISM